MLKTNIQYLFIRLLKDLTVSYLFTHWLWFVWRLSVYGLSLFFYAFSFHFSWSFYSRFTECPKKKETPNFFILERDRKWECSNIKYCSNIVVDVLWSGNENYLKSKHSPLYSLVSTLLAISCEISRSGISKFPWQCQVAYNKMIDSQHLRERAILL